MPLVIQAIDQYRHLLNGKIVDVEIDLIDVEIDDLSKPIACGHSQAFSIAVNNLVRNAFLHTLDGQGPITIHIKERVLFVTNRVSSEANESHPPAEASSSQGR